MDPISPRNPLIPSDDHPGATNVFNSDQEAAEPRKMYGTSGTPNFGSMMPSIGDPVFVTDAQNNDEFYAYDSDLPIDTDDA